MTSQTYYSNGKLLLTGEYVVLDGAESLAVPTRFGQNLVVNEGKSDGLQWTSFDADQSIWFTDTIAFDAIKNRIGSDLNDPVKNTLIEILYHAHILNPKVLSNKGYEVETHLTFPRNWGLGTSSTLINNIAQWFQIDAFKLLHASFGGSGYDIACAQTNHAIVYQLIEELPSFTPVPFEPSFKAHIYFVYLNQKQSSKSAIANYMTQRHKSIAIVPKINKITQQIIHCKSLSEFAQLMEYHEILMSEILETTTIKERFFPDFDGVIKSLGAWGGDFIMVIAPENPTQYFKDKGFDVLLPYDELILQ